MDLNLEATELRLGLPGTDESNKKRSPPIVKSNKRASPEMSEDSRLTCNSTASDAGNGDRDTAPPSKIQVVGWPPVRSYRKNNLVAKSETESSAGYLKVSMDGAPYLRKIDLKVYKSYPELIMALENMFKFIIGKYSERERYNGTSDYTPTYQDKDGDWMLVGDVPWEMFSTSCKRLRIMKGSEARGLGSL